MALDPIADGAWYKRYSAGNRSILEDVPVGPTPAKPEYLYAWTDPNPSGGTTYYAWYYEEAGRYWYTLSSVPSGGDNVYEYDSTTGTMSLNEYCGVYSYNPNTNVLTVGTLGDKELCQRDSEADVTIYETLYAWYCDFDGPSSGTIENRRTIYTKTPNPTTSTPIYDENGNVLNLGSSVSAASSSEITITY